MNQILDHSGPKKKKAPSNSNNIYSIVKVFAVMMIIFGVSLVASGSYTFANNNKIKNSMNAVAPEERPVITAVEIEGTSQVKISVTHTKVIEKVAYRWDDLESTTQKAKNNQTEMTIDNIGIPTGDHVLTVEVWEVANEGGNKYTQEFNFSCENGNDVIDPVIDIIIQGTTVEISAEDETALQYVTYRIGDGEEETLYPSDDNPTRVATTFETELTETTDIVVTAVDTSNNESRMTRRLVFYEKPKISFSASADFSQIIVDVSCPTPLTKLDIVLNGEQRTVNIPNNATSHREEVQVTKQGRNDIKVTAYTMIEGEENSETAEGYVNYGG